MKDENKHPHLAPLRSCEKTDLVLFHVIPAPHQVRGKLQPESSFFNFLRIDCTGFHPAKSGAEIQFLHSFGRGGNVNLRVKGGKVFFKKQ
jgi:hypothetical protein